MNKLKGIIEEINSEGHLSIVKIKVYEGLFSSIVIDTPKTAPYLIVGNYVNLLFKENEVVIAKTFAGEISLQNRFEGVIKLLETGKLLSKVVVKYFDYDIVSIITSQAAQQMKLAIGDHVTAMVKTNEISLSPDD